MKNISIFLIFASILFSCKKETFEHEEAFIFYPCDCRLSTDSVEGTYVGRYLELELLSLPPLYDTLLDTIVSVTLQKIPNNQNFISDSIYCRFLASGFLNGEIVFKNNNLHFTPKFYSMNMIDLNGDLVFSEDHPVNHIYSATDKYFRGIKQ